MNYQVIALVDPLWNSSATGDCGAGGGGTPDPDTPDDPGNIDGPPGVLTDAISSSGACVVTMSPGADGGGGSGCNPTLSVGSDSGGGSGCQVSL